MYIYLFILKSSFSLLYYRAQYSNMAAKLGLILFACLIRYLVRAQTTRTCPLDKDGVVDLSNLGLAAIDVSTFEKVRHFSFYSI